MTEQEQPKNDFMHKLALQIVERRNLVFLIVILGTIFTIFSRSWVKVESDLTTYLPKTSETRMGLDIMEKEFTTYGSADVMVANITPDEADRLNDELAGLRGIQMIEYDDTTAHYNNVSALYSITFDYPEDDDQCLETLESVKEYLKDYDIYVSTSLGNTQEETIEREVNVIMVYVAIIIVVVLIFTSQTYAEVPVLLLTFVVGMILNMGTNFLLGTISFVSNSVTNILQLALSLDYAIIFCNHFKEEHETLPLKEAVIESLAKSIPEISSSSLTTMAGMVALMFMQFGIGLDLGRVMIKAILLSMLSVFGFMPGLIMLWEKQIDRTLHKSFVPNIEFWGKIVLAIRHVTLPVFAVVMVVACFLSVNCNYVYDNSSVESAKMNEYMTAKREISKVFDLDNTLAVVVPKGDYDSEARIMEEVESLPMVDSTLGLANVTVDDDEQYVLTDSLTPQELADITDMDIDTIRLLYRFYAWKEEKYGAFLNSIDDFEIPLLSMIDFIYGEEENETFDFSADFSQDIQDMHKTVSDAREQLEGDEYSRMLVMTTGPIEGDEIFHTIDQIRDIAYQYYHEVYVVGDSTSDYDLSKSFTQDNLMVSIMTAVFVAIILLFTFTNYSIPLILVATIQTSIWINFSIPAVTGTGMFFLSYLIVSSIQMGATIDYAIVITSRYTAYRKENVDKRTAIIKTLNESFPTIITSGTIMTSAGFVIGQITSNPVIASLGTTLGTGTLTSIILVMLILPQLLYAFDGVINKTYRKRRINIGGGETQTNGGAE